VIIGPKIRSLTISSSGGTGPGHLVAGELCRRREVPRWRRPGRGGAGPRSASSPWPRSPSSRQCWTPARRPAGTRTSAGPWPGSRTRPGSGSGVRSKMFCLAIRTARLLL